MAKIVVLYHSRTGRTQQMANLVAEGARRISQSDVRLKSIAEADVKDIFWCDGIAVGSPTNLGAISWPMKKFWDDLSSTAWGKTEGKIACAFSSSGSYGGGGEITCMNINTVLMNYGFLVFGVTDYTDEHFSPHYGAVSAGYHLPDGVAEASRLLGQRLAEWCAYYVDARKDQHPVSKKQFA